MQAPLMSAFPNSPQLPEPDGLPDKLRDAAPQSGKPQSVAPLSPHPGRYRWPLFIFLLAALAAAWFLRPGPGTRPAPSSTIRTARAIHGVLEKTRRVAGSIIARRFANIAAPILQAPDQGRGLTLIYLAASGSKVQEGEVVARIDDQAVRDHLDDVEAGLSQAALDIRRREAQLVYQMEALRQRLRVAKATLDKANQDARAIPARTAITQEQLQLAVEEAREVYRDAQKQIPLTEERQEADLNLYRLNYQKEVRHRNRHLTDRDRCTIKSPIGGMVVLQTGYRGGEPRQIQIGDLVSPGQPFLRVMDTGSMQLDATINQSEAELVRIGQPADLHFDAFPGLTLNGRVEAVGSLAVGGRRLNYNVRRIPVRIGIEESNTRVIPDLTASADIQVAQPVDGILLPREAVIETDGKNVVYVKQAGAFVPREVAIGASNDTQVSVTSGIQAGDEVALEPPSGM
jgi:multidrug efflux pump subunit AcrA (membrane-fusion protein)